MAKALKKVGVVLGAAALVASGVGAIAGIGLLTTIGTIAGVAAGIANVASQSLAKSPPARGSVSQLLIATDAPRPYIMGEGHFAGVLRHRTGYGGTVDKVKNPYLFDVVVYSGVGPVQSITPQIDFAAVPAWYTGFLATDTQLGAMPEADALVASYGSPTGWGASYKLSGHAAIAWNFKFDKSGEKYGAGVPLTGALVQGVKAYDPRLDSTFPGGVGAHRLNDEATWAYSANPALHAATYAYGRFASGKRVMGIGLPAGSIDWSTVAAWANVCDANGWGIYGVAFEPGDRWANLKDICFAGGAEPIFSGAILSFRYDAPVVALDTITPADVAETMSVTFMQSFRDRLNTIIPKYRSATHNWEMVDAQAVQVATYLTEDGEERREEWAFNFVKSANQAAQLAAYKILNSRELHPIQLRGMPRLRGYRPGDCLHLNLPELGLNLDAVIVARSIDPATMTVDLTLVGETPGKHAYALGETATPPPTPALGQGSQERDETATNPAYRGLNPDDGTVKDGKVTTAAIVANAVTVPSTSTISDTAVGAGSTVTVHTTGSLTVGDATDGGAIILCFGEIDSGTQKDVGGRLNIYIDSGGGWVLAGTAAAGVRTVSGDSYLKGSVLASATIAGVSSINVKMEIVSIAMPGASAQAFTLRSPQVVILGAKR